ncbi:hypothetical protein JCM24511_04421 [Saitozyma sp. JCM 24511]|nr:hypothetical protein JCM24511_04421 [Saitozyma sp. JCM 24511]
MSRLSPDIIPLRPRTNTFAMDSAPLDIIPLTPVHGPLPALPNIAVDTDSKSDIADATIYQPTPQTLPLYLIPVASPRGRGGVRVAKSTILTLARRYEHIVQLQVYERFECKQRGEQDSAQGASQRELTYSNPLRFETAANLQRPDLFTDDGLSREPPPYWTLRRASSKPTRPSPLKQSWIPVDINSDLVSVPSDAAVESLSLSSSSSSSGESLAPPTPPPSNTFDFFFRRPDVTLCAADKADLPKLRVRRRPSFFV